MPANVDTKQLDGPRAQAFWSIAKQAVLDIDGGSTPNENIMRYLLHLGWHEGAQLRHRQQIGGGPGRGFSQFEPNRAKDALEYADKKGWLRFLAAAVGQPESTVRTETQRLPAAGGWPQGGLVEQWLAQEGVAVDYFCVLLTRIDLRKIPAPIGTTTQAHADYWADYWKRVFANPADRSAKIQQFLQSAAQVDTLIPAVG